MCVLFCSFRFFALLFVISSARKKGRKIENLNFNLRYLFLLCLSLSPSRSLSRSFSLFLFVNNGKASGSHCLLQSLGLKSFEVVLFVFLINSK